MQITENEIGTIVVESAKRFIANLVPGFWNRFMNLLYRMRLQSADLWLFARCPFQYDTKQLSLMKDFERI